MKRGMIKWCVVCGAVACLLGFQQAGAFMLDEAGTMEFKGKLQARTSFATEDQSGWNGEGPAKSPLAPYYIQWDQGYYIYPLPKHTFGLMRPSNVATGQLVQQKNQLYMEFNHDLKKYANCLGGFKLKYHLLARIFYDSAYDIGPDGLEGDIQTSGWNKHEVNDFQYDIDLWEGYVDATKGPFFLRIGRQKLAWGESDLFRLLDNINPLDNGDGFIFDDLDDRRMPIFMARASWNFGNIGPISSAMLEGFLAPQWIDDKVAPIAPWGTRYAFPLPPLQGFIADRGNSLDDSRFGFRQMGVLWDSFNYTLAYEHTYMDNPAFRINCTEGNSLYTAMFGNTDRVDGFLASADAIFKPTDVLGASGSFYWGLPDLIVRSEVAYFFDESVFTGNYGSFNPFADNLRGSTEDRDMIRFVLGLDKNVWIRALNKNSTFFMSVQYFGQIMRKHDDTICNVPPDFGKTVYTEGGPVFTFPKIKEYEQVFTFLANTEFWHGRCKPQFIFAYDPRGVTYVQPQVELLFDPFRILFQYSSISGQWTNFGFWRDRDQITTVVTWMF